MEMQGKYLVDEVTRRLREQIIRGELKPGQRIVEREIAQKIGVSRTPVREAVRRLESEGLLAITPNKGAIVTSLDLDDMKEIYLMRSVLEGLAARAAADYVTDEDLAELHEIQDAIREAVQARRYSLLNEINTSFHFRLYDISPWARLNQVIKSLWMDVKRMRATTLSWPGRAERVVEEHELILQLLKDKNAQAVEEAVRTHVMNALKTLEDAGVQF
jgi:DNA-binding GntR family transcriptional regulator